MDYVSEFEGSTDDSTHHSFWESNAPDDDSTETGSEVSGIHSGSEPEGILSVPLQPERVVPTKHPHS